MIDYLKAPVYTQTHGWVVEQVLQTAYGLDEEAAEEAAWTFLDERFSPKAVKKWERKYPGILDAVNVAGCEPLQAGDTLELPVGCVFDYSAKAGKGAWFIHFSDATFHSFEKGAALQGLAYSKHFDPMTLESGETLYGFAFQLDTADPFDRIKARQYYGYNFLIFQCDYAIYGYHSGDEEEQAIWPLGAEYNVLNATNESVLADPSAIEAAEEAYGDEVEYWAHRDEGVVVDLSAGEVYFDTVDKLMELIDKGWVDLGEFHRPKFKGRQTQHPRR